MEEKSRCAPEINYPCQWQYRIIGEDRTAMYQAVASSVEPSIYTLTEANVSSSGRYLSLSLELIVQNDAERLRFYQLLAEHPAIRMVL